MTSLKGRDQHEKVKVLDAANWMKGCSSLGRLRFAVLLEVGKKKRKTERFCLVDIKVPQDLKLKMDQLTREEAIGAARFLASVIGKALASQMNHKTKVKWRADLNRNHSKKLDEPSWLWTSVVELVASHEAAYLEHCRVYAMQGAARTLGRAHKV
jgi:uncharacterized protein (DUF2252 family)